MDFMPAPALSPSISLTVSAVIITLNEEHRLPACLDSLAWVDEIVVVDSGSSDQTRVVAEAAGARFVHQDWLGYGRQKQFAVQQATNDWVLCVDADERLDTDLQQAIQALPANPEYKAWQFPRCNRFMGRWLRFGEGYPDLSLRLFHRDYAHWSSDEIHEGVDARSEVGTLQGDLLHESEQTLEDYLNKQNRYTSLQAAALFERGKSAGLARLLFSPLFRFVKFYFIRQGFRDGLPGLVHIAIGCHNSFVKYAKLIELQRMSRAASSHPDL